MKMRLGIFIYLLIIGLCNSCTKESMPPVARFSAFPTTADTLLSFEFNAGACTDDNTLSFALLFRWDFETDGNWDTQFNPEPKAIFRYNRSGIKTVTLEVMDSDKNTSQASIQVEVKPANQRADTLVDPRDNQQYPIVKIQNIWWMATNLNYGQNIHSSGEQLNNGIAEKYYLFDDSVKYRSLGGLYRWEEAMNYSAGKVQGLCPPGWRMPTVAEWRSLLKSIDSWYAWTYYGPVGLSGLNIGEGAFAMRRYNTTSWVPGNHFHWSCDKILIEFLGEMAPWFFTRGDLWGEIGVNYQSCYYDGSDGLWSIGTDYASVRCIKKQ